MFGRNRGRDECGPHMDPILLQQQPQNTPISIDNRSHKSSSQNIPTNVIEHSGPSSPRYVSLEARVSSFRDQFKSWPPGLKQKPEELAEAGFFYYGIGDQVSNYLSNRNFLLILTGLTENTRA